MADLIQNRCGCPAEELLHLGTTVCIHADPGVPISAYSLDDDLVIDLQAATMTEARVEACKWIDKLRATAPEPPR